MFLDETGVTTTLLRRYGRALPGTRVYDHAPCARWQTSTFLAALRVTGLTAPAVFEGAIDGPSFLAYLDQILVPTLHPGDIVIADNLGAHKVRGVAESLAAAGAAMWYLPPSSPDPNPIELCFAKLKAIVRAADRSRRFGGVGSEEARVTTLASVRRSNCTCSFPACSFHESAARVRGVNDGIRPIKLTSPSSPRRREVGSTFHPGQRHRRKRCDHKRRSTHPSSWWKSLRT